MVTQPVVATAATDDGVLQAERIVVDYGARPVLDDLSLSIGQGTTLALVGPNGSGKSTLLKALARLLAPRVGRVWLDGQPIIGTAPREVARRLAVLPQSPAIPQGLTVREVVQQGRHPHRGALRGLRSDDHAAVTDALDVTGLTGFADRMVDRLSGGERQRVWIALTLAQQTPLLLLDEPTTFLDIGHQLEVLALVARLRIERGLTAVLVLHDLNQAARHADRMVVLSGGRIVADGPPVEVLTPRLCAEVFGAHVTVITDPVTGTPVCLPHAAAPRTP